MRSPLSMFAEVGTSVWEAVPRELRTELWLSATVARANSVGSQAYEEYMDLLNKASGGWGLRLCMAACRSFCGVVP